MKLVKDTDGKNIRCKYNVSDKEAEEAFKTILTWLGEDPNQRRVIRNS